MLATTLEPMLAIALINKLGTALAEDPVIYSMLREEDKVELKLS